MTLLITYIVLALGVSFVCSLLEAALLTLTPATISSAKERGRKWAVRDTHGFMATPVKPSSQPSSH